MLLLAGFIALATDEVLQRAALVLFSPRKLIVVAEQVVAIKSARPEIKCRSGRTISVFLERYDPERADLYELSAACASRMTLLIHRDANAALICFGAPGNFSSDR